VLIIIESGVNIELLGLTPKRMKNNLKMSLILISVRFAYWARNHAKGQSIWNHSKEWLISTSDI